MQRKEFLKTSALLMGAVTAPAAVFAAAGDVSVLQQTVVDYYKIYYADLDKDRYRALLTDDYLLLENGEVFDTEKDISLIPKPEDEYRRVDTFDYRLLKVQGDTAHAVYFLKSDIRSKKDAAAKREWLESMLFRRSQGGRWQVALLHSTKIEKR
jgi:ketosteroid isomerase-like protein